MEVKMVLVNQDGSSVTSASTSTTSSVGIADAASTSSAPTTLTTSTISSTSTDTATSASLPYTDMTSKGFAFVGCSPEARRVNDGLNRTLTGATFTDDGMTNEKCLDFCVSKGATFAGTEYRRECYCGDSVAATRQPQTTAASLSDCNLTCMGNPAELCGGQSWMSLYKKCTPDSPCLNAQFS